MGRCAARFFLATRPASRTCCRARCIAQCPAGCAAGREAISAALSEGGDAILATRQMYYFILKFGFSEVIRQIRAKKKKLGGLCLQNRNFRAHSRGAYSWTPSPFPLP